MNIADFEKELVKNAETDGANYKYADLHIHSPGSSDYQYSALDNIEKLAYAINSVRLSFAAIVSHNSLPSIDILQNLQRKCPNTLIIPGAEVNIFVDAFFKKVSKDHYFHCLALFDPQDSRGHEYLLSKAKEQYTWSKEDPTGFESSIYDIGRFFQDSGAIFIAAHLHQSKEPHTSRSVDDIYDDESFLGFIAKGAFSALEVRNPSTGQFFAGGKVTQSGLPIPAAICVQSSDAHHHEHIEQRKRFFSVRSEHNTFDELRTCFSLQGKITLTAPSVSHARIVGLHISGSFLKNEWILLNSAMNCLIGCKGSGKTSVLECLRFVLGTVVPDDRKDSVVKHISHILGPSGFVECLVVDNQGNRHLLTRRMDSPNRLMTFNEAGHSTEVSSSKDIGFDVSVIGWHEIEGIADNPSARIKLMDDLGEGTQIEELYKHINQDVESARDQLPSFQRLLKNIDDKLRERNTLRNKRNTLKRLEEGALLSLQNEYEKYLSCEQNIASMLQRLAKSKQKLPLSLDNCFATVIDEFGDTQTYPNDLQHCIGEFKQSISQLIDSKTLSAKSLQDGIDSAMTHFSSRLQDTRNAFANFRLGTYEPKVNTLPPEEREILSKQIQIIEQTKALPDIEQTCKSLQLEIRTVAKVIHDACDRICQARENICSLRQKVVDEINRDIPSVQVRFLKSANHSRRQSYQNSYGKDAASFFSLVDSYGQNDTYQNLKKLFSYFVSLDVDAPSVTIQEQLCDAKWVDFLKVYDDDDVELALVLQNNQPTPIQNLSAGQRCTTVFPLLMRSSRGPLIIDQPEDNLDNRHIADVIAPQFMQKKLLQQFVLTSHNANLVVLTDADLIMHADSNGTTGSIVERGYLACSKSPIKNAVLNVLDGGEAAILSRKEKYGID